MTFHFCRSFLHILQTASKCTLDSLPIQTAFPHRCMQVTPSTHSLSLSLSPPLLAISFRLSRSPLPFCHRFPEGRVRRGRRWHSYDTRPTTISHLSQLQNSGSDARAPGGTDPSGEHSWKALPSCLCKIYCPKNGYRAFRSAQLSSLECLQPNH